MEMDSDSEIEIPRKRLRTEMFTNECIICGEHGLKEQFCQPKDQESWTKLLEAATLRQFESFFGIKNNLECVPDIYYHPECRKTFCHKKALTKIKKEQSFPCLNDKNIETAQRPSREKPESSGSVYAEKKVREKTRECHSHKPQLAYFATKTKYQKGTKNREKITQAVDLRADNTKREAATKKGDTKIMAIASRELVAAEAHYHISCTKKNTHSQRQL